MFTMAHTYSMIFQVLANIQLTLNLLYQNVLFQEIGKFEEFTHNQLGNL